MKLSLRILFIVCLLACTGLYAAAPGDGDKPLRILLVTGGHGFDKENFFSMMDNLPGITYDWVQHPAAHQMFRPDSISKYDVVLLYDMPKEISDEARQDFIAMLRQGKGLVALHHAFCSYDFWPEYTKIIGGRYHHFPWNRDGVEQPVSSYKHDVIFDVKVEDSNHPITVGVKDFSITDETYKGFETLRDNYLLLSTDAPTAGKAVGWTRQYEKARVVTCLLGHDNQAWQNPSFTRILLQSVLWAGRKI